MNIDLIIRTLGNSHRRQMLTWLKNPRANFPPPLEEHENLEGVCGSYIFEKSTLSQATVSQYLSALEAAGLVKRERHGQWTFFRRDEDAITNAALLIKRELTGDIHG